MASVKRPLELLLSAVIGAAVASGTLTLAGTGAVIVEPCDCEPVVVTATVPQDFYATPTPIVPRGTPTPGPSATATRTPAATPAPTQAPTRTPTPAGSCASVPEAVQRSGFYTYTGPYAAQNVRSRPGTTWPIVGSLPRGERRAVHWERWISGSRWVAINPTCENSWVSAGLGRLEAQGDPPVHARMFALEAVHVSAEEAALLVDLCKAEVYGLGAARRDGCLSVLDTVFTRLANNYLSGGTLFSVLDWHSSDTHWQFVPAVTRGDANVQPSARLDARETLWALDAVSDYLHGERGSCSGYLHYDSVPGGARECLIEGHGQWVEFYRKAEFPEETR